MLNSIRHPGCLLSSNTPQSFLVTVKVKAPTHEANSRGTSYTLRKYLGGEPSPPVSPWPEPSLWSPPIMLALQELGLRLPANVCHGAATSKFWGARKSLDTRRRLARPSPPEPLTVCSPLPSYFTTVAKRGRWRALHHGVMGWSRG